MDCCQGRSWNLIYVVKISSTHSFAVFGKQNLLLTGTHLAVDRLGEALGICTYLQVPFYATGGCYVPAEGFAATWCVMQWSTSYMLQG
jgi:hypothetical protein